MRYDERIAVDVQCPFYKGSGEHSLICEGLLDDSKNCVHTFQGRSTRIEFMKKMCCNNDHWKDCSLARKLWEKY